MTTPKTALVLAERRDLPPDAVLWTGQANGWTASHVTTNQTLTLYVRPVATALRRGVELVDEHGTVFATSFYVDSVAVPTVQPAPPPADDDLPGRILAAILRTAEIARITAGGGGLPEPQWTTHPSRSGKWKVLRETNDATPIGYIDDGRWEIRHIVRHDPASVLVRCAADLRTLERHRHDVQPNVLLFACAGTETLRDVEYCLACTIGAGCDHCISWSGQSDIDDGPVLWPCPTIRDLAEVYDVTVATP